MALLRFPPLPCPLQATPRPPSSPRMSRLAPPSGTAALGVCASPPQLCRLSDNNCALPPHMRMRAVEGRDVWAVCRLHSVRPHDVVGSLGAPPQRMEEEGAGGGAPGGGGVGEEQLGEYYAEQKRGKVLGAIMSCNGGVRTAVRRRPAWPAVNGVCGGRNCGGCWTRAPSQTSSPSSSCSSESSWCTVLTTRTSSTSSSSRSG